jgi:KUP system potassium uptake protein
MRWPSCSPIRLLGFLAMGSVFLVVTGAEALYADMGHFGRRPIRLAWFGLVLPALLLNYFGQGALLLRDPASDQESLLPAGAGLVPAAAGGPGHGGHGDRLAGGDFRRVSITQQAIQLGYAPRMELQHTSDSQIGQIYCPA